MGKQINTSGNYAVKETGETVNFEFEFTQFDTLQDAVDTLGGEQAVLDSVQRMHKVDKGNTAREKAKVANGHSVRKVLTEDEKAVRKADRAETSALVKALKAKGLTLADIQAMD